MKKTQTFIFVHDERIIIDFIKKNKFWDLSDLTYVFLGSNPTDNIKDLDNVIIAKNYDNNIENYPKLTSFTGWYILWKNNLIKSEYINLFEYDINCVFGFGEHNKELISKKYDFIGYFPMSIQDIVYTKMKEFTKELFDSYLVKNEVDLYEYVDNLSVKKPNLMWSSSSNSTWKTSEWVKYMEWFDLYLNDVKNSWYSGHIFERSISIFYFLNNLNVHLTNGLMEHLQLNTHGTSPLDKNRFDLMYKNLI